ncbi:MAG: hypothetical protein J0I49_35050 [Pseudonocardia sp.]|uniref:hypothetical protein n=1 Tax=Pseudonocardia sp. TaxID=60912 RepID=UPI001ACDC5DB|nr:hypothetical protein [Pseudonocardia sp.]MBN9103275.1 hypothetical protein [Pseudonocardia sp.]
MLVRITPGSLAALRRLTAFLENAADDGALYHLHRQDDLIWATEVICADGTVPEDEFGDASGGFTVDAERYERDLAEALRTQQSRPLTAVGAQR